MEGLKDKMKILNYKEVLKNILPVLKSSRKKGDNGISAIIGGSEEYTGAPFYAAISSLKTGVDLSHIFCHKDAMIPLKCYSPEFIVHKYTQDDKTTRWLKNMDSIVYGCGMGREDDTFELFKFLFFETLKFKSVKILDADALWHFMNLNEILDNENYSKNENILIFTPNVTEFDRLYTKFVNSSYTNNKESNNVDIILKNANLENNNIILYNKVEENDEIFPFVKREIEVSKQLKNKIILKKGEIDIITDGNSAILVGNQGSLKRCGGTGDILAGILSSFTAMLSKSRSTTSLDILTACAIGCYLNREAARNAYNKFGYSLTAPDVIHELCEITKTFHLNSNF